MSQYGYHGSAAAASASHSTQLAPLSNLQQQHHPYQQPSPGPPTQLPPLHGPAGSFNGQLYRQQQQQQQQQQHQPNGRHTSTPDSNHLSSHTDSFSNYNPTPINNSATPSHTTQLPLPPFSATSHGQGTFGQTGVSSSTSNPSLISPSAPYNHSYPLPNLSSSMNGPAQRQSPASSYGPQPQLSIPGQDSQSLEPRHMPVVGSQARRNILPSAPASAAPPSVLQDSAARNSLAVPKNPDGKYPCTYCNKTYQHLKHLKRHLLRHTGERPYSCALCNETFCRSDILKRHFQKCQIRRGNPNGVTHLTHAHAHRRNQQTGQLHNSTLGSTSSSLPPPSQVQQSLPQPQNQYRPEQQVNAQGPSLPDVRAPNIGPPSVASSAASSRPSWHSGPNGFAQTQYGSGDSNNQLQPNSLAFDSNRSSRSSSIMRPGSAGSEDKKRYSGATSHTSISTGGMGMNASPSAGTTLHPLQQVHDSSKPTGYGQASYRGNDRMSGQQNFGDHHDASFFNSTSIPPMAMGTQAEASPSYPYGRQPYQQYGANNGAHGVNETWGNYFHPVAHNDVMFSS